MSWSISARRNEGAWVEGSKVADFAVPGQRFTGTGRLPVGAVDEKADAANAAALAEEMAAETVSKRKWKSLYSFLPFFRLSNSNIKPSPLFSPDFSSWFFVGMFLFLFKIRKTKKRKNAELMAMAKPIAKLFGKARPKVLPTPKLLPDWFYDIQQAFYDIENDRIPDVPFPLVTKGERGGAYSLVFIPYPFSIYFSFSTLFFLTAFTLSIFYQIFVVRVWSTPLQTLLRIRLS